MIDGIDSIEETSRKKRQEHIAQMKAFLENIPPIPVEKFLKLSTESIQRIFRAIGSNFERIRAEKREWNIQDIKKVEDLKFFLTAWVDKIHRP